MSADYTVMVLLSASTAKKQVLTVHIKNLKNNYTIKISKYCN